MKSLSNPVLYVKSCVEPLFTSQQPSRLLHSLCVLHVHGAGPLSCPDDTLLLQQIHGSWPFHSECCAAMSLARFRTVVRRKKLTRTNGSSSAVLSSWLDQLHINTKTIIFKRGGEKTNWGRAGGETAHTNINKHSSSVSEPSCFI